MQQGLDRRRAARPPGAATTPLVRDRRDAPPKPTTWDDALNRVAQAISRSHQRHGRDSVGCFGGGGLTNEKAYQLGKFARVALGTSQIDDKAVLHVLGRRGGHPRLRHRPGACRSRWLTSPRRTSSCWSAPIRPTLCRRRCSGWMRGAAAAQRISPSTPGAPHQRGRLGGLRGITYDRIADEQGVF